MIIAGVTILWVGALALAMLMTRRDPPKKTLLAPTAPGAVTAGYFATINTINLCPAGWCARYGFPLPFVSQSDAIIVMNGEQVGSAFSPFGATVDAVIAVAGIALVQWWVHVRAEKRRVGAT